MEGKVILVRHGETEANRQRRFAESEDIPLTDTGRRQSAEIAARLAREFRPDLLLSSPFLRARQTSEIIGSALDLKPEVTSGIHERDFGCLKGRPYEDMGEMMLADPAYNPRSHWLWKPPAGESLHEVRLRAFSALDALREGRAREILVVCHGAVIQAICAQITGEWRESYVPPNCGFAVLEFSAEAWKPNAIAADWIPLNAENPLQDSAKHFTMEMLLPDKP
ncbi:MAG: histidine phosphatase family protein [Terriglobia bacterium]